ncbi:MAG: hypothetical protein A3H97_00990 [Acidobacteria bacterium RIFCSPLOWO2_02_FULL_65_29]|nr:MAG: hypothetical protein A3H97_00990 [Acidobacteria bacterium RIFCSPLOWO2_02_FULL_65_29]
MTGITYPGAFSGSWSGSIAPGGFQDVTVTFAPTAAAAYGGTVTVSGDQTSGTNTIAVSGTGAPTATRVIGLSGNLAFGVVRVGMTPVLTLRITNTGSAALAVTGISYPPGFSGFWSGSIAPGGVQDVQVTFTPTTGASYGAQQPSPVDGSGVDTVHVWAYPAAGDDPIFLGVADSGDSRPDVAATYGTRFDRSSFSLTATGLPPGVYDVVVYAHRASTHAFEGAQSVR